MKKILLLLLVLFVGVFDTFAQNKQISGKVTGSDDGLPVVGATVKANGSNLATQTDANGSFSFSVPSGTSSITVSFIGFTAQTVTITGKTSVDVKLQSNSSQLSDVVVVGYGSGRRVSNVVGNVATVTTKDIENKPVANVFDAIQGKVAGVQIYTSSGEPSQTPSVRINGAGSLSASSTPLYVLDGIPLGEGSIVSLNPNDFESITFLKDASSTSIYGARAANGVIFLTSKKGSANKPASITISSQYGISKLANLKFFDRFMNAQQYIDFRLGIPTGMVGALTQAGADAIRAQYGATTDTKWYKEFYKNEAPLVQTTASVSGGSGKTTYYVSGGYYSLPGIAYRSDYNRYTLRSNVASAVNDWMQFGLNLSAGYDKRQSNPYGSNSTARGLALLAAPYYPTVDANGEPLTSYAWTTNAFNPRYRANLNPSPNNNLQFNPTGYIQITPFKGLTVKSQAGLDGYDYRISDIRMPSYLGSPNNGSVREEFQRGILRTVTNTIEYRFNFLKDHNISALAGQESIDNTYTQFFGSSTGQTDDRLILLDNGPNTRNVGSSKTEYSFQSFFGRLNYDFKSKYFLDATVRQDKSSRFGVNNRAGTFWAVGGMWKASEEDFLKKFTWLNDLSVRASTGTSGNSEIGNYTQYALVGTNTFDGGTGWAVSSAGNPNLTWEKQHKTTIGVSGSVFNRVRFEVDYYNRITSNMLLSVPYPYTSGFASINDNVGKLKNYGWEANVDFDIYKNKDRSVYITPNFNFNFNKNKVLELFQDKSYWAISGTGVAWVVGQPVTYLYPIFKGVNTQTGLPEWYLPGTDPGVTRKDDNAVTSNFSTALQQATGIDRYPKWTGGFGLNAGYHGLTLSAQFSYATRKNLINNDRYFYENPNQFSGFNQYVTVNDYWRQPGDVATFPKYGVQFTQFDTRLIEDASFLRLKVLTLGYTIPQSLLKYTKVIKGLNFYLTGRNILTFTKYQGPDPEVDSNLALGTNPNTKQYTLGMDIRF